MSTTPPVVVVGAGFGGLSAAIALAAAGRPVRLYERSLAVGGKADRQRVDGQPVPSGPTVLTMRWVFDELLARVGARIDELVQLQALERLARHAWPGGTSLDLYPDRQRSIDAVGRFAGTAEAARVSALFSRAAAVHRTLRDSFLTAAKPGPLSLTRRTGIRAIWATQPFRSLWRAICNELQDPRLRQLFARYATYCGSSPYLAPATLMMIVDVEQAGVWRVSGGLSALAEALASTARNCGVDIQLGRGVAEICTAEGRVSGVQLDDGERQAAEAVVVNADSAAVAAGALGRGIQPAVPRVPRRGRSLSAVTWAFSATAEGLSLDHHTVAFSDDYLAEFTALFRHRRTPAQPTVYLCAEQRPAAVSGPEPLFCLVNAPADGDRDPWPADRIAAARCAALDTLSAAGIQLTVHAEQVRTPTDYARRHPGSAGALYGRASHGWRATFARPGTRTGLPGLYLAGGTVHPGPGVPMATLSGMEAARCLHQDLISANR